MVDLETLGTRPGCKIVSIGAVVFSPLGLGEEFYSEIKINGQGSLVADPETLAWWEKQDPELQKLLWGRQREKPSLRIALLNFNEWLKSVSPLDEKGHRQVCLWGNGADFDNPILLFAFHEVTSCKPAWEFWNNRCYRTLKSLVPTMKLVREGTHHNALDDAKSQAFHAIKLLEVLTKNRLAG